jgi:hypothetical protein
VALRALGKLLAREGQYDTAEYLLEQCCRLAEAEAARDVEAERLLARLEELAGESAEAAPVRLSFAEAACAGLLCLTDFQRDRESGEDAGLRAAWETVLNLESRWHPEAAPMAEVLSWTEAPGAPRAGPWLYLRGVCSLAGGDSVEARRFFRRSARADASRRNPEIYLLYLGVMQETYEDTVEFLKDEGRPEEDIARTVAISARVMANNGEMDAALHLLDQAAERGPRSGEILELRDDFADLSTRSE